MAWTQLLLAVCGVVFLAVADAEPGRIPKVYNALITSNQNLEPSKAYPVYQPVLQDVYTYSYQPPFFYGSDLLANGLLPAPALVPKEPQPQSSVPSSTPESVSESSPPPATDSPATTTESAKLEPESSNTTPVPLSPPNTPPPIPLNEFGLPPQVTPLGPVLPGNAVYNAISQFNPFAYRYPSFRFYDPYDPFAASPYNFPSIYSRPISSINNVLGQNLSVLSDQSAATVKPNPPSQTAQTPPPEPSDLNILNYSSKDPAIPNVPPPPLPQGGLKTDKDE